MCEMISFKFEPGLDQPLRFGGSLNSHSDIPGDGYECEWTGESPDLLTVRMPPDVPESKGEMVREWILARYDWHKLLAFGLRDVATTIETLNLSGLPVQSLPDGLSSLKTLDASGCTGLQSLPDGLSSLVRLDARGCTGLQSLPDGLSSLVRLDASGCTGL